VRTATKIPIVITMPITAKMKGDGTSPLVLETSLFLQGLDDLGWILAGN